MLDCAKCTTCTLRAFSPTFLWTFLNGFIIIYYFPSAHPAGRSFPVVCSDDNNCQIALCTTDCQPSRSSALGNSLSQMDIQGLLYQSGHVSPCVCDWVYTEVRTRQILCLYSSWLHGTVKCSYDHHQPPPPSQSSPRLSEHFELWAGISSSNILLVCSVQHSDLTKSNQQGQSGIILCNYHLSPPANVPPSLESPDTLTPLQAGGFYVFVNHS